MVRKTIRIPEKLNRSLSQLVANESNGRTENAVIEEAIKLYLDYRYMRDGATLLNDEIIRVFDSRIGLLEHHLNNKANQVISCAAIELGVLVQTIANNLDLSGLDLQEYRKTAVDHLKVNNRVLRLEELRD